MIDPELGWDLVHAFGINDHGHIVGHGYLGGATTLSAFMLVPEPSSIALLLCGAFAGLFCWRRKRRSILN